MSWPMPKVRGLAMILGSFSFLITFFLLEEAFNLLVAVFLLLWATEAAFFVVGVEVVTFLATGADLGVAFFVDVVYSNMSQKKKSKKKGVIGRMV